MVCLKQHLTCVKAAREICNAQVTGDELYSDQLQFLPGKICGGDYQFDIGSAGSTTLVAQTILPALMTADAPSKITIVGGTHNMSSPPFDFLDRCYLPQVEWMGPRFDARINQYGFYPAGGGMIEVSVTPCETLQPIVLLERLGNVNPNVTAIVANLPEHIGEREIEVIRRKAGWRVSDCEILTVYSTGPGNVVLVALEFENTCEIFSGFGRKGVRAEDVANRTWREAKKFLEHPAPVGEHLADQLLLPMGLSAAQGNINRIRTTSLSLHATTHIDILKVFLNVRVETIESDDGTTEVVVGPATVDSSESDN